MHLLERRLDAVFLAGDVADRHDLVLLVFYAHLDRRAKGKLRVRRRYLQTDFHLDLLPVPLAHAGRPHGQRQRHVNPEGLDLPPDRVAVLRAVGQLALVESLPHLEHHLERGGDVAIHALGVQRGESAVPPSRQAVSPTLGVRPELVERVELLRDLLHGAVVRLFDAEHALARVIQVRPRQELLQLRHHLLHPRRVNRALLHVGETSELRHGRLQCLRLAPEVVLLRRLVLLELEHELRVLFLDQHGGVLQLPREELRRRQRLPERVVQRSPHRLERLQIRVRLVQHHLLLVARQRDRLRVVANFLDRLWILRRRH
mmetsp:Transcript_11765/g.49438  ORF Transcript_11765/g.49438 Transcript_11765/m.49438 type:complete len:316 (-) Transcript_11765:437-1384(-)